MARGVLGVSGVSWRLLALVNGGLAAAGGVLAVFFNTKDSWGLIKIVNTQYNINVVTCICMLPCVITCLHMNLCVVT